MTLWESSLDGIRLFAVLRLDETKRFSHFSNSPLLDKDLFQDTVERTGNLDASFVALDFAENVECLNRSLRLDAPTMTNEPRRVCLSLTSGCTKISTHQLMTSHSVIPSPMSARLNLWSFGANQPGELWNRAAFTNGLPEGMRP